ncbi:MAG: insulinase family protein [Candidatus Wallbacteria bacterium]|nr:insulinase family protein [Candidatus Wallbacteria bacterium]
MRNEKIEGGRWKVEDRLAAGFFSRGTKRTAVRLALGLCLGVVSTLWAEELWVHPSKMAVPPLVLTPPKAERVVLENGMVVHLLEDHELPIVRVSATVKAGSWLDPDEKLGLAEIAGAVMRTGGTRSMTGDDMNETLEFMAAGVETSIGSRSGGASLDVLAKDLDAGLKIFSEVLMFPAFAADKVELRKKQVMEGIRRRNDEPGPICAREFGKVLYAGHPFGRVNSLDTVDRITRDDLVAFHKKYFFPNNLIVGVAGDFKRDELLSKLKALFSDWPKGQPPADPPDVPFDPKAGVYFVEKDVPQASIRIGHLGIKKSDPDYFAIDVMNFILGGSGFTSRLMREIRSNQGLAYSVGSYFSAGQELGSFGMVCQTKSSTTARCIEEMKKLAAQLTSEPVTEEELKIARESILNSFVFEFQSSGQIVGQAVSLEYNKLPPDYLQIYKEAISKVTAADILRVAKKHLLSDRQTVTVVGKAADFDKPLSTFGPVKVLPLEDFSEFDKKHKN